MISRFSLAAVHFTGKFTSWGVKLLHICEVCLMWTSEIVSENNKCNYTRKSSYPVYYYLIHSSMSLYFQYIRIWNVIEMSLISEMWDSFFACIQHNGTRSTKLSKVKQLPRWSLYVHKQSFFSLPVRKYRELQLSLWSRCQHGH